MRAEHILPDHVDRVDIDGVTVRKGTVAAFLTNARVLTDSGATPAALTRAQADVADMLPALRALGLFDVLEIRDAALRAWVDALIADRTPKY